MYRILRNVNTGQYLRIADGPGCRMNTHIRVLVVLCLEALGCLLGLYIN